MTIKAVKTKSNSIIMKVIKCTKCKNFYIAFHTPFRTNVNA